MSAARSGARGPRGFGLAGRAALTRLGSEAAVALIGSADVSLVVDAGGVIVDAAAGGGGVTGLSALPALGGGSGTGGLLDGWIGRRMVDVVTPETRGKVEAMLREAGAGGASPRRQVNHPNADGPDVPVAYTAVRVAEGATVLVGRDLRAVATLQQRLVETQQALERDYWRLRHVETRYRLLFQRSREAVLVVDAQTRKVVDANAAAGTLFNVPAERLVGRAYPPEAAAPGRQALDDLLVTTRFEGVGDEVLVTLTDGRPVRVAASCFRQDAQTLFLVRFAEAEVAAAQAPHADALAELPTLLAGAPDAFVVTDAGGDVRVANRAFLDLAQLGDEQQAVGRSLSEWVGRPGADLPVLLTMLRQHGVVRLVGTAVRGEHGTATEVELSAVLASTEAASAAAWMIRDVGRRVGAGSGGARDLTRAVEQLTGLVGRVSLPELVRDTVEMVERHFIEAALELTSDNRTAAAEVLGLSRQSLYLKLRRHRLLPTEGDSASTA